MTNTFMHRLSLFSLFDYINQLFWNLFFFRVIFLYASRTSFSFVALVNLFFLGWLINMMIEYFSAVKRKHVLAVKIKCTKAMYESHFSWHDASVFPSIKKDHNSHLWTWLGSKNQHLKEHFLLAPVVIRIDIIPTLTSQNLLVKPIKKKAHG